jgi:hypothetical protein
MTFSKLWSVHIGWLFFQIFDLILVLRSPKDILIRPATLFDMVTKSLNILQGILHTLLPHIFVHLDLPITSSPMDRLEIDVNVTALCKTHSELDIFEIHEPHPST